MKLTKLVIYVPTKNADQIRQVLAESGAGHIGNYDYCSFSVKGTGRFRPLEGTNPHIGQQNKIEEVEEERIETVCSAEKASGIVAKVRESHPYEKPAIDVYPLMEV